VVEQIRSDDLEIVLRGVGEGALAVTVPERPDARRRGLQLVVDDDVAALIAAHPGFVEIQIVGIRPTADGQQQMRASDFGGAGDAIDLADDLVAALDEADAFRVQPDLDALALDDVLIAADTSSSSSSWRTSRGAISMIVTSLPKRRYIWPNSRPI
jgi:hypothetical protein